MGGWYLQEIHVITCAFFPFVFFGVGPYPVINPVPFSPPTTVTSFAYLVLAKNQQIPQKKLPSETSHRNGEVEDLSAAAFGFVGRSRGRRRRTHSRKISKGAADGGGGDYTDEKAEVEEKIVALQKIVPGGEALAVEKLFEETAEYILTLEWQVKALRFLAGIVEGSEKEERKLGG
ncbi:hypothetical protein CDL12_22002 [Handroanthus impetiginosus]|uniref:BHLH domain-containing protein n=1 Tax=Handroanthus impetiginosus TaxID=429701 RepID=A0A2G9GJI9_9LAMI|nr:hypothetical protein CDL12_22002 [Handroanthus impetiginosus]